MASPFHHSYIKQIRALRGRTQRDRTGLYWIEGIRIVMEAIQVHAPIQTLVVAPELLLSTQAHELVQQQRRAGVGYLEVSAEVFSSISAKDGPCGLGAVMRQRWDALPSEDADASCWVALDAVQDPGNLGTILRTSDAVGGSGLLLLGNTTDPYDPRAMRASMGALFTQGLVRTEFGAFLAWARQHHYCIVGAAGNATHDYRAVTYPARLILLMGAERTGLSREQQRHCDAVVHIPMIGRADSLNLAVATGVLLYEAFYGRRHMEPALLEQRTATNI